MSPRPSARCSKDIYWFDLPVCLAYSITLYFPTLTVAAAASAHFLLLLIDTPSVGGTLSFLFSQKRIVRSKWNLTFLCVVREWISHQPMAWYGTWLRFLCHLEYALWGQKHPTALFRDFHNISLFFFVSIPPPWLSSSFTVALHPTVGLHEFVKNTSWL